MTTKEQIHDAQIAPLMMQIVKICQENGVACFTSFELDNSVKCTTHIADENGEFPFARAFDVVMRENAVLPAHMQLPDAYWPGKGRQ